RGSLLERTGGIAVSAVEILQARFLQCGHHGDRLRVLRQVCALADADDGAGVVDLFGAELIRVVDAAGRAVTLVGARGTLARLVDAPGHRVGRGRGRRRQGDAPSDDV